MSVVIGIVVAFTLLLAYVRAVQWLRESRTTRFAFEDRETYLLLTLDRPLGDGGSARVTMQALREALLLKVAGIDHKRVLIQTSALDIANARAFALLIGALEPVLKNEKVHLAVVCRRGTRAARLFQKSAILSTFPSVREAERHLQSAASRQRVLPDAERSPLPVPKHHEAA